VHGLTKVDGQLAGAADPPRTHQIKLKHAPPADCPWRERRDDRRL
jgi:hypothetical protein